MSNERVTHLKAFKAEYIQEGYHAVTRRDLGGTNALWSPGGHRSACIDRRNQPREELVVDVLGQRIPDIDGLQSESKQKNLVHTK